MSSPPSCRVCAAPLGQPLYASNAAQSLTSLCQLRPTRTQVWFCGACGHLSSPVLEDNEAFYANDYRISLGHDDEDQIYEVRGNDIVYRTAHQLRVLAGKLTLQPGSKVLDYGCAKADMSDKLKQQTPGLDIHLFDVSEMYRPFWQRMVPTENCAVMSTPPHWQARFDLVTSYFSLEHIPDPAAAARHIASLLTDDGALYAIVPNVFTNTADFVVVDHVNHFTAASVTRLLQDAGLSQVEIDDQSHRGALVIVARKGGRYAPPPPVEGLQRNVQELAHFWSSLDTRLAEAERDNPGPVAIYGSGFYGAYVYAQLQQPQAVAMFLDQSPFQQGRQLFGVPISAPDRLPDSVRTLYVALNPRIAQDVIAAQPILNRPALGHVYLGAAP